MVKSIKKQLIHHGTVKNITVFVVIIQRTWQWCPAQAGVLCIASVLQERHTVKAYAVIKHLYQLCSCLKQVTQKFLVVICRVDFIPDFAFRDMKDKGLIARSSFKKQPCGLGTRQIERFFTEKTEIAELSGKLDAHKRHILRSGFFLQRTEPVCSPEGTAADRIAKRYDIIFLLNQAAQHRAEYSLFS